MIQFITEISDIMFVSDLEVVTFGGTKESEDDRYRFAVTDTPGTVVFDCEYYPDADGNVTVYAVDKILRSMLNGASIGHFTLWANDDYRHVTIVAANTKVNIPASEFVDSHFLTTVQCCTDTDISRHELLSLFSGGDEVSITADCRYYDNGQITDVTKEVGIAPQGMTTTVDVSPRRFADADLGRLISYTVKAGDRQHSYRVLATMAEPDPVMIFRNCFGCWETISFIGTKKTEPKYTRYDAYIGGRLVNYDINEIVTHKAYTGPLSSGEEPKVLDLCRSTEIHLLTKTGEIGDEITITDSEVSYTNEPDMMSDFTISYRRSSKYTCDVGKRIPKLFDDTFDHAFN